VGQLKKGARILGIDDSPFEKGDERVLVVGVVERGGKIDGVLSTAVDRDGDDATERLAAMLCRSRFLPQVRVIMLNSIMMAGFNVVDIPELLRRTGKPVIAVVRRKPDMKAVRKALENVCCVEGKVMRIKHAGEPVRVGGLYAQLAGISEEEAAGIMKRWRGIPEPIRLAHVIAGGVVKGESTGKA